MDFSDELISLLTQAGALVGVKVVIDGLLALFR